MTGAELIAEERKRQVESEGWTPEHDDQHPAGTLIKAAKCYVRAALYQIETGLREPPLGVPLLWPWESLWWKPSGDPVRNLVKAGALIAAEIDRVQRRTI